MGLGVDGEQGSGQRQLGAGGQRVRKGIEEYEPHSWWYRYLRCLEEKIRKLQVGSTLGWRRVS